MTDNSPNGHIFQLVAGIAGAVVSMNFVKGTLSERIVMAIGGAALSYFASDNLAQWLNVPEALGLLGFLIGLFGMAIVAKIYLVIELLDAKQMALDVWETIKRKWSA